ncbi:hypothetical protein BD560DRAFT_124906 [Blakeslea trispora]|nr:hypothetical protein BD560DRAFT_124906 [Blakeslea trispora]
MCFFFDYTSMEPARQVLSNTPTKSHIEKGSVVSLDKERPMIGPKLETMRSTQLDELHNEDERMSTKRKLSCWRKRYKDEATDPKQYSTVKKNTILFVVAIGGMISPISSTLYYPALVDMQYALNTSATAMNASLSIFTFFTAFFPLVWATFGDSYEDGFI